MNRESIGKQTGHISDVQRHESELERLTPEETDARVYEASMQAVDRWESCDRSFKMLFGVLGGSSVRPADRYDIKTDHAEFDGSIFETYVRVWKDTRDNTYKTRPMVRVDGCIEDNDFRETESFGDTFVYRFGTTHSRSATVKVQDMTGGGVKLERKDGKLVDGITRHETAILLSAIDGMIMPTIQRTEDTLILLWDAVRHEEWNPVYARSFHSYFKQR